MAKYQHVHNPHAQDRDTAGPAVSKRHYASKEKLTINERIGLTITKNVGTMWAAYVFFALALVSLPAAIASGNVIVIVAWIAQTFLQLVLLPIIIVGQNIQAKASDDRALATYRDATAILHEAREIQRHLATQDEAMEEMLVRLQKLEGRVR